MYAVFPGTLAFLSPGRVLLQSVVEQKHMICSCVFSLLSRVCRFSWHDRLSKPGSCFVQSVVLFVICSCYIYIYIYIYRERERYNISLSLYICMYIYIYIYIHTYILYTYYIYTMYIHIYIYIYIIACMLFFLARPPR